MPGFRSALLVAAVVALGIVTPGQAQSRSAVSQSDLDAAVAVQSVGAATAVRSFVASESGRQVADRLGLTAAELSVRVATIDPATLERLQSRADAPVLAGGANVVISTTAVIIALLLLILIVD